MIKKIKALNHEIEELEKKDKEIGGILRSLEDALAEAQRVNAKSQSTFGLKKKNLACEESKRKELEKNMVEPARPTPTLPLQCEDGGEDKDEDLYPPFNE